MNPIQMAIEGAITLAEYLASLPEKDRAAVTAKLRAAAASLVVDIQNLDDEIAKTKAAAANLPPPTTPPTGEPPK